MFYLNNKVLRRLLKHIDLSNIYNQGGENEREKDTNSAKLEVELVLR